MTRNGIVNMLRIMTDAYPNFRPADMKRSIDLWESMLADYSDTEGAAALKAYIASNDSGFAPSIGQIIGLIPHQREELPEFEAWNLVVKAICNGNYGAEHEFARLPAVVREAVGSPAQIRQWANIDIDDLQTVAQSNFLRSYRAAVDRQKVVSTVPSDIRKLYEREQKVYPLPEIDEPEEYAGTPAPPEVVEWMRKLA